VIMIAAILAAGSVYFFMQPLPAGRRPRNRLSRVVSSESKNENEIEQTNSASPTFLRLVGIGAGALLGWTFGGAIGLIAGAGAGFYLIGMLSKRENAQSRIESAAVARDTPVFIDLLAATLTSGATMQSSLSAAANAMQESPIQTRLAPVLAAIELGADPRDAWSTLMYEPVLGQLAMSVMRSYDTGSGLEPVLVGIASEMRREHRSRVEVAARTAGVKAVIPLAVCFLPAFFALGVVPIVASLAASTGLIPD
jgi:Flp pilus assembly protein TadB